MRASFVATGVWDGLRRNLGMTVALILTTAISLVFVGGAVLASIEISRFKNTYEDKLNVSVYMCPNLINDKACPVTDQKTGSQLATQAQKDAVRAKLDADPNVVSVVYRSEAESLQKAKSLPAVSVGAEYLKVGDLPAIFIVHLKDLQRDFDAFKADYSALPGVNSVSNQQAAINTLLDVLSGARTASIVVALVVLVASILLLANTIRAAAAQRKEETSIMRLVGASRWMTELPFVLEAIIATIVGGILATVGLAVGKYYILNNIFAGQTERQVIPDLHTNEVLIAGGVGLLIGIVLSAVTAFATLRLYVRL